MLCARNLKFHVHFKFMKEFKIIPLSVYTAQNVNWNVLLLN